MRPGRPGRPAERCLQQQPGKCARRRRRERNAGGIVRLYTEAGKLGADPTRKASIGGDERRLALLVGFEREPKRDRDGGCLFAFVRRFDQRHIRKGGEESFRIEAPAGFHPDVSRVGR